MVQPIKNDTIVANATKQQFENKAVREVKKISIPLNKFEGAPKQLKEALPEYDLDKNGTIDNKNKDGLNELSLLEKLAKAVGYEINTNKAPEVAKSKAPSRVFNQGPIVAKEYKDWSDALNPLYTGSGSFSGTALLNAKGQEVERKLDSGDRHLQIRSDGLPYKIIDNEGDVTNLSYHSNGKTSKMIVNLFSGKDQNFYGKRTTTFNIGGQKTTDKNVYFDNPKDNTYREYDTNGNTTKEAEGASVK